jgi:hypothetical protein
MFFFGCVDNCTSSYICIALGFEFQSKIVPFGAKNFVENLSIFIIFLLFSIFQIDNKSTYRILFIVYILLGIFGSALMIFITSKYKRDQK